MGDIASPSRSRWGHKRSLQLVQSGDSSGGDSRRRAPFLSHASCPTELVVLGHSGSHGYGVGVELGDRSGVRLDTGQGFQEPALQPLRIQTPPFSPPYPSAPPGGPKADGLAEKAIRETTLEGKTSGQSKQNVVHPTHCGQCSRIP